jgi:hypothetical protein
MSEIRPRIEIIRDVGYKVISTNEDGTPKQVWRCLVKEGQYGKFISIERHWVRRMKGNKITESDWARRSFSFPFDKEKALGLWNSLRELIEDAFASEINLEEEVEEEFEGETDERV